MKANMKARVAALILGVLSLSAGLGVVGPASAAGTFATDDVFVGVGSNKVQWRSPDGDLNQTLTTASSSSITTGMGFDAGGKLYVTGYTSNVINRFQTSGAADATFGSGFNSHPESITFDGAGNAYVGQERGSRDILKFGPSGNLLAAYDANPEGAKGTDRLDLALDQCTIYYTSQGQSVRRFNVCTNTQGPNLTESLPGREAFDVKVLPTGGVLVADTTAVYRLNTSGDIIQTYDQPNRNCWVALALDSSGFFFWAADRCASQVYRFHLDTGNLQSSFTTGTKSGSINGLAVSGGTTAALRPGSSGNIPPEGGTISTNTGWCPDPLLDPACADVTFPRGPGGFASVAEVAPLILCSTFGRPVGPAFDVLPPDGYNDETSPIRVIMVYDESIAPESGGHGNVCAEKLVEGVFVTVVLPDCQPIGHAFPAPCVNGQNRDKGYLEVEVLMLSGDPKFQFFQ
jgi:hypothetical protein